MLLETFHRMGLEYQRSVRTALLMPGVNELLLAEFEALKREYLNIQFPETITTDSLFQLYAVQHNLRTQMQVITDFLTIIK